MHILAFGMVISSLSSILALIPYCYHLYSRHSSVPLAHLDIIHKLVEQKLSQILHYTLIFGCYHHVTGQYNI